VLFIKRLFKFINIIPFKIQNNNFEAHVNIVTDGKLILGLNI